MDRDTSQHGKYQYLCCSWQSLLQQLVYQLGRGYYWYNLTVLPEKKRDKWLKIDRKLIDKYACGKSKFQRYRAKLRKEVNYLYIRWEHIAVILKTGEKVPHEEDRFESVEDKPLTVRISPLVEFKLHRKRKETTTVFLSRDTYRGLKAVLTETACKDNLPKPYVAKLLLEEWNKINGFPSYAGIVEQKSQLLTYVVRLCKRHHMPLAREDFRFVTKRKIVKVWTSPPDILEDANGQAPASVT